VWGESLLPFTEGPAAGAGWRVIAVFSSAIGLLTGRSLVRRRGPVAPLSPVAVPLEQAVELIFVSTGRLVLGLARGVAGLEGSLDYLARSLTAGARNIAGLVDRSELGFDSLARGGGAGTLAAAAGTDFLEREGFGDGADGVARSLSRAGAGLRVSQTGRLYLYTLGLFLWVGTAGLLSLLWWR
ncbi:MAG TPA: hypothetical protein VFE20_02480, partial [Thermoleophilia bacterium]|nr:hypothetical protein [Thermoleophilia bacterium]